MDGVEVLALDLDDLAGFVGGETAGRDEGESLGLAQQRFHLIGVWRARFHAPEARLVVDDEGADRTILILQDDRGVALDGRRRGCDAFAGFQKKDAAVRQHDTRIVGLGAQNPIAQREGFLRSALAAEKLGYGHEVLGPAIEGGYVDALSERFLPDLVLEARVDLGKLKNDVRVLGAGVAHRFQDGDGVGRRSRIDEHTGVSLGEGGQRQDRRRKLLEELQVGGPLGVLRGVRGCQPSEFDGRFIEGNVILEQLDHRGSIVGVRGVGGSHEPLRHVAGGSDGLPRRGESLVGELREAALARGACKDDKGARVGVGAGMTLRRQSASTAFDVSRKGAMAMKALTRSRSNSGISVALKIEAASSHLPCPTRRMARMNAKSGVSGARARAWSTRSPRSSSCRIWAALKRACRSRTCCLTSCTAMEAALDRWPVSFQAIIAEAAGASCSGPGFCSVDRTRSQASVRNWAACSILDRSASGSL